MKLIATKSLRYATRRMLAGDEFEASSMHARILVGARKARYAPAPSVPHDIEPEDAGTEIIDRLRSQADRLGIKVDKRWGAARLAQEIARKAEG